MRYALILPLALLGACATAQTPAGSTAGDSFDARARAILRTTPLVDGHNDLPWAIREYEPAPHNVAAYDLRGRAPGHTDIPRLQQGMVGAQFWSVYIPSNATETGAAKMQLEQIDIMHQVIRRYPDVFELALTADDAERIFRAGKVASMLGMEGGHALENSLGALRTYYDLGARYMTLTHSANVDWADSCCALREHDGLTEFGREVVREMNRLGMLVDISHVAPETMHDALEVSVAPVIFSHSSAKALTDHPRNVPDDVLRRLPQNGGVVMITFVPSFISQQNLDWSTLPGEQRRATPEPRATMADVIRHIEHVRDVAGIDHVGIGGDFDGISSVPVGLEDVSTYPALVAELLRRGWSDGDVRKLIGDNVMRAWRQAEQAAARLQRERGPSTMLFPGGN
ncbi:MAG TPA: dipeptidase [Longimicrobiales bacterium]|nr:dipeptidase [Longimicrobiales bacterium]